MEIKIEVDETKFKDVIEKELNAFSKEELHEIIRECIVDSLKNSPSLKNLFVVEDKSGYYTIEQPSQVMIDAAKSIDLSPAYKEVQEKMINILKTDYHSLLEDIMLGMIKEGFLNDYNFKNRLVCEIEANIRSNLNNQN